MTREYLLDAIGLIDDDLIQDAEVRPAPVTSIQAFVRRWGSLAACLALVLTLSYVFLYSGGMKKSEASTPSASAPASSAPAASAPASSAPTASESPEESPQPSSSAGADSSTGVTPSEPRVGTVFLGSDTYRLSGDFLEELPEGCRFLDTLVLFSNGAPSPSTTVSEYVGCALWTDDLSDTPAQIYIQISEHRYAVAELAQP